MGLVENSKTDFKQCQFGLAMSGGGYRATLFHLGALRRLNEIGWLNRLERVTSVSGGSLLLGFLLAQRPNVLDRNAKIPADEWQDYVSDAVHTFVKNDLRTIQSLQNLTIKSLFFRNHRLSNTISRLEKIYGRKLSLKNFLYDADRGKRWPEIFILATDLINAKAFRFSNNPKMSGNKAVGFCDLSFFPLATACASSASFPPLFGPVQLGHELKKTACTDLKEETLEKLSKVALSDGGLYDNIGKNLISGGPEHLVRLFSDAGIAYTPSSSLTKSFFVIFKYMMLMGTFIGRLNYQMLHLIKKNDFAFWSAQFPQDKDEETSIGYSDSLVKDYFAKVRTDLDYFTTEEACMLENHGYAQAELSLRNSFGKTYTDLGLSKAKWPYPKYVDETQARRVLEKARKRKFLTQFFRLKLYK